MLSMQVKVWEYFKINSLPMFPSERHIFTLVRLKLLQRFQTWKFKFLEQKKKFSLNEHKIWAFLKTSALYNQDINSVLISSLHLLLLCAHIHIFTVKKAKNRAHEKCDSFLSSFFCFHFDSPQCIRWTSSLFLRCVCGLLYCSEKSMSYLPLFLTCFLLFGFN